MEKLRKLYKKHKLSILLAAAAAAGIIVKLLTGQVMPDAESNVFALFTSSLVVCLPYIDDDRELLNTSR